VSVPHRTSDLLYKYLRTDKKFPHLWCPGCGNGIVMGSLIRAVDKLGLDQDDVVVISGIGCSGRMPVYVDFNTLHTTHGRALAFAAGLKLANPDLHVIVVMGDGDATAIGGNHFIHAARRNLDITAIVINNHIYGMTGGQYSPTTPTGDRSTTSLWGVLERPFDICKLAMSSGTSFVARSTVYHVKLLDRLIVSALEKNGFAMVEAVSTCPTTYGRYNKKGGPVAMMKELRDQAVPVEKAGDMAEGELTGRLVTGVLQDVDIPEYCDMYDKIIERAGGAD
jgi:2-oxoglutarate ferredoxin oxidoreductase subunit beta